MKPLHGSSPLSQDPVDPCRISEAYSATLFDLVVLSQVTNTTKAIIGVNERVCVASIAATLSVPVAPSEAHPLPIPNLLEGVLLRYSSFFPSSWGTTVCHLTELCHLVQRWVDCP
ncbi:hypothetical protein EMCRGX_G017007 [Ephydatia muelleri]